MSSLRIVQYIVALSICLQNCTSLLELQPLQVNFAMRSEWFYFDLIDIRSGFEINELKVIS